MASTYITRTMSNGSATTTKFTFSAWVKRTGLNPSDGSHILSVSNEYIYLGFANDTMRMELSDADNVRLRSNAVFRDTNAWYHVVFMFDSTQATSSNRMKMWVNNEQITSFAHETYPSQNYGSYIGGNTQHTLGRRENDDTDYFDGVLAHAHLCVGYAYSPSDFGETDSTTGIWKPKTAPSVTYGNNGFFLKFENSASMGTDSSGNSNNFTVNGTMTQTIDTPSNVFATLNPLVNNYGEMMTLTQGNLTCESTTSSPAWKTAVSTLGMTSGKYFWEIKLHNVHNAHNNGVMGSNILTANAQNPMNQTGWTGFYNESSAGGEIRKDNAVSTYDYGTFSNGDIMGVACDMDNYTISFYKNGVAHVSNVALSTTGRDVVFPASVYYQTNGGVQSSYNFGNGYFGTTAVSSAGTNASGIGIFEYDVPTGYTALSTKGLNL